MNPEGDEYGGRPLSFRYLSVLDRAWNDHDRTAFAAGSFNGVRVDGTRVTLRGFDPSPLGKLPGLRALEVLGPIKSDKPVEDLTTLRHLALLYGSGRAFDFSALRDVEELTICGGREYRGLAKVNHLVRLELLRWRENKLSLLHPWETLRFLRVETRGQPLHLSGIEGLRNLEALMVLDGEVSSLAAIGKLQSVRSVYIVNRVGFVPDEPLDLEPLLSSAGTLEELRLANAGRVRSLSVLRELTSLHSVTVFGSIDDGDLSPMVDLPANVRVGMVADRPHHSHSDEEIERLRAR